MLLDTDFFSKPETAELTDKFGSDGAICILKVCAVLMNEDGARISERSLRSLHIGTAVGAEKWWMICEVLFEMKWLERDKDPEYILSKRAKKERDRVLKKRKILSANGKQKHSISTDTDTDTAIDNIKKNGQALTKKFEAALREWIKYRIERKPKLTFASVTKLAKRYKDKEADFIQAVDFSISQGWQGVYSPQKTAAMMRATNESKTRPQPKPFVPVWEREKQGAAK